MVETGLLEATYRRLTGRTGPGSGRPTKLYRRASFEHSVSLPPRHYDLAAELLAEAMEESGERAAPKSLTQVAHRHGERVGQQVLASLSPRASGERRLGALAQALDRYGYEPRREGRAVRLGNCPFHALAVSHRDLVCGMNLSLLEGVVDGMESSDLEARRDPRPGECCDTVSIRRKEA